MMLAPECQEHEKLLSAIVGGGSDFTEQNRIALNFSGESENHYAELKTVSDPNSQLDEWLCDPENTYINLENPNSPTNPDSETEEYDPLTGEIRQARNTLPNSIIYVNEKAKGKNDGTSWKNAYTNLQKAIETAGIASEIWVAKGTYEPTQGKDRDASFELKNLVKIYGGFAGNESKLSRRNWKKNKTILSGDIGKKGDISDNSFNVVENRNVNPTAVLDGFTITGGNANGKEDRTGAGMYNSSSSPVLANLVFINNSSESSGGGMLNSSSSPTLTNVTFENNSAKGSGGGMTNWSSNPTLTKVTFKNNSAMNEEEEGFYAGGGMYNSSSSPTLTDVTFIKNSSFRGGGMGNRSSSNPTLNKVTFEQNSASDMGGGIYSLESSPTMTDVIFNSNSAEFSGGGIMNWENSSPKLKNVTFTNNSSGSGGGGMTNWDKSNPKLTNVTFSTNFASWGAGISNSGSNPTLTKVTFNLNSATGDGGGISNSSSNPTLTNVAFSLNSAGSDGGGMDNYKSNPKLTNVTFSTNSAGGSGGGMFSEEKSKPTVTNSIFWGNQGSFGEKEILNDKSSSTTVTNSIVEGGYKGADNIKSDPKLVDPLEGNLRLQSGSPAIDAGDNKAISGVKQDLAGKNRIVNKTVDIGAYEFAGKNSNQESKPTEPPAISIKDVKIVEGDRGSKKAKFAVTLDRATDETVQVKYATASGTAKTGEDFKKRKGTLTFKPGEKKNNIVVPIFGDFADESDETFALKLSKPKKATIGISEAIATIRDNDEPPADREPNNTFKKAINLGPLTRESIEINGKIGFTTGDRDTEDYYRFEVNKEGRLILFVDTLVQNADVEVYGRNEELIASSNNDSISEEEIDVRLDKGSYYVLVQPKGSDRTSYRLSLNLL